MNKFLTIIAIALVSACSSFAQDSAYIANLRKCLSSGDFYIDVKEIMTSGRSIRTQTSRFFTVFNDSVHVELPYVGEMHTPVIGQNKPKIEFDEAYTDYKYKEDKKAFSINMEVKVVGEHFNIRIKVPFSGAMASLIIEGSRRESIRYTGTLYPLKELSNRRNPEVK